MTTNVGTLDRMVRAAVGLILHYLVFVTGSQLFSEPVFKYGAAVIGIAMLATTLMKLCPLFAVFSLKTCREC